jgi:hypothetical protein
MTKLTSKGYEPLPLEFQVAIDILETIEDLETGAKTPTPAAIRQALDPAGDDPTITLARIEQGLARVASWQAQPANRMILEQRKNLQALKWQVYFTGLACHRLHGCLETLLGDIDQVLNNTLSE